MPLHADELTIDAALVRGLLDRQLPAYADAELRPLEQSGSSNALFRLGDDRVVRLPRQPGGGASILKEATWAPFVAQRVGVAVPEVVAVGEPDLGYPEHWSVTMWLEGTRPTVPGRERSPHGTIGLAHDLAHFLGELRAMDLPDAGRQAPSWYRGEPLHRLDDDVRGLVEECRGLHVDLDLDAALRLWDEAAAASEAAPAAEPTWFHGDLLAENLLVDPAGRLAAVLDLGGLAVGDPTVDLVVAWEVLDAEGRDVLRRALDVDDRTWLVSRGWALLIALMTFPYYGTSMPGRCADRLAMAQAALGA